MDALDLVEAALPVRMAGGRSIEALHEVPLGTTGPRFGSRVPEPPSGSNASGIGRAGVQLCKLLHGPAEAR